MIFIKQSQDVLVGLYCVFLVGIVQSVESNICYTETCKNLSQMIRDSMKRTIHPCDNFYDYACGAWIETQPQVPTGYSTYPRLSEKRKELANQLCDLLGEEITPNDSQAVKAAKIQYKACLNDDKLRAEGLTVLINITKENGGWPMIEDYTFRPSKKWQEVHDYYLLKTGDGSIMNILMDINSDKPMIVVDQGTALLNSPFDPTNKTQVEKRIQFIYKVAEKFASANKANVKPSHIKEDAIFIYNIDQALNKLRNTETFRRLGPQVTIDTANQLLVNGTNTEFDLYDGLQRIFGHMSDTRSFNKEEIIRVRERQKLRKTMEVLSTFTARDILNYIHFHFIVRHIRFTTPEMIQLYQRYFNIHPSNRSRSVVCMNAENLKVVLSNMYLKRYFSPKDQKAAENLVNDIKQNIEKQLRQTDWIDLWSLPMAIWKVKNLDQFVGYKSEFVDNTFIDEFYSKYNMGDSYVINMLNFHEVEYKHYLSRFGSHQKGSAAKNTLFRYPIDLSSSYHSRFNRLVIPATNLQPPLFSRTLAEVANYAGAGALAANLMASLYDELGRHFDDRGSSTSWLSNSTTIEYNKRYKCYEEQLANYTFDALNANGATYATITTWAFPQNFYDSFGLKTAFEAYIDRKASNGLPQQRLPNLDEYNAEKQFFLVYANHHCQALSTTSFMDAIKLDSRSISRMRVNIAVSNLPQFSAVFNCPKLSPMNPSIKCSFLS